MSRGLHLNLRFNHPARLEPATLGAAVPDAYPQEGEPSQHQGEQHIFTFSKTNERRSSLCFHLAANPNGDSVTQHLDRISWREGQETRRPSPALATMAAPLVPSLCLRSGLCTTRGLGWVLSQV